MLLSFPLVCIHGPFDVFFSIECWPYAAGNDELCSTFKLLLKTGGSHSLLTASIYTVTICTARKRHLKLTYFGDTSMCLPQLGCMSCSGSATRTRLLTTGRAGPTVVFLAWHCDAEWTPLGQWIRGIQNDQEICRACSGNPTPPRGPVHPLRPSQGSLSAEVGATKTTAAVFDLRKDCANRPNCRFVTPWRRGFQRDNWWRTVKAGLFRGGSDY